MTKTSAVLGVILFLGSMAWFPFSVGAQTNRAVSVVYVPEMPRLKTFRVETQDGASAEFERLYIKGPKPFDAAKVPAAVGDEQPDSPEFARKYPYPEFFIEIKPNLRNAGLPSLGLRMTGSRRIRQTTEKFLPYKTVWQWETPKRFHGFTCATGGRELGREPDPMQRFVPVALWAYNLEKSGDPQLLYFDREKGMIWQRRIPVIAALGAVKGLRQDWISAAQIILTEDKNTVVAFNALGAMALFVYDSAGDLRSQSVLPGARATGIGAETPGRSVALQITFSRLELLTKNQTLIGEGREAWLVLSPRRNCLALLTDESGEPVYGSEVRLSVDDDFLVACLQREDRARSDEFTSMAFDWKNVSAPRPPLDAETRRDLIKILPHAPSGQ